MFSLPKTLGGAGAVSGRGVVGAVWVAVSGVLGLWGVVVGGRAWWLGCRGVVGDTRADLGMRDPRAWDLAIYE